MEEVFLLRCLQSPLFVLWGRLFKLPSHSLSPPPAPHCPPLSLRLSDFRRCLSNDPEQPSASPRWWIKSVPLAFEALVGDSKGRRRIKKRKKNLFLWESERGRVAPWSALVELNSDSLFFIFCSVPEVMDDINKTLTAMASQGHHHFGERRT